jgi:hypothetical protein
MPSVAAAVAAVVTARFQLVEQLTAVLAEQPVCVNHDTSIYIHKTGE